MEEIFCIIMELSDKKMKKIRLHCPLSLCMKAAEADWGLMRKRVEFRDQGPISHALKKGDKAHGKEGNE